MYKHIKRLLKRIIHRELLFEYEAIFRQIYYQFYRGRNFRCNICSKGLRKFISLTDGEKLCPNCGSISRDRRLWKLLDAEFLRTNDRILDFSPSRSIYRALKNNTLISYTGTDVSGDFLSEKKFDITNIDISNETFDLVICYHVLEHIENDVNAIKELYRILKKEGTCIIQTPFKEGTIYENSSIKTEEDRLLHFGQEDHLRIYSVNGLKDRLLDCKFEVEIREYKKEIDSKNGFRNEEIILICRK